MNSIKRIGKRVLFILLVFFIGLSVNGQGFDSTQIGEQYPYFLPFLGAKAYTRGYKLPLPHGIMLNTVVNKQNIVLENFEMAFGTPSNPFNGEYLDFSEIINFGENYGKIVTTNARIDTWILPFLSVGGFFGKLWGEQTIQLVNPLPITSTTDLNGDYWGFNMVGVVPLGFINLAADYSWTWSKNDYLEKPVKVKISGMRLIKNFPISKTNPDMFLGVWGGAQFQNLGSKTEGSIALKDALDPEGNFQEDLDYWYNGLTVPQKELYGDKVYEAFNNIVNSTVHYRFDKRLEYNWNMILGGQWQINRSWQVRAEYGFLKSKQSAMISLNYRFGI